jgi:hypothetical protein
MIGGVPGGIEQAACLSTHRLRGVIYRLHRTILPSMRAIV